MFTVFSLLSFSLPPARGEGGIIGFPKKGAANRVISRFVTFLVRIKKEENPGFLILPGQAYYQFARALTYVKALFLRIV